MVVLKYFKYVAICGFLLLGCSEDNPVAPETTRQWTAVNSGLTSMTIQDIVPVPGAENTLFAGTINGVFKTENAGGSWTDVSNDLASKDARCLFVDPNDVNVIYCGTQSKGVFKSVNSGQSWTSVWKSGQHPLIYSLFVTSGANSVVWAGSQNGLYKSTDGGQNWTRSFLYGDVIAVTANPNDPNVLYIGVEYQGIFKTTDGGENWNAVNTGIFKGSDGYASANSFIVNSDNVNQVVMSTGNVDLYKTTNAGQSWTQFAETLNGLKVTSLTVNPANSKQILAATTQNGVYQSTDAGSSWNDMNTGLETLQIKRICFVKGEKSACYAGTIGKGVYKYVF